MSTNNQHQPSPHDSNERFESLRLLALEAKKEGDFRLALHLYLAAYESLNSQHTGFSSEKALSMLGDAWDIACGLQDRVLAEHIFELMEPYLDTNETQEKLAKLQELTFARLAEYGLSAESLEEMAQLMNSQEFIDNLMDFSHVESLPLPFPDMQAFLIADPEGSKATNLETSTAKNPTSEKSDVAQQTSQTKESAPLVLPMPTIAKKDIVKGTAYDPVESIKDASLEESLTYHDLVGYDSIVSLMRDFGVGMQHDAQFQEFITMLNDQYGLEHMPATDTFLFRSPCREDAFRFMMATVGEIGYPCIRMRMEESVQGLPMLCVLAPHEYKSKNNFMRNGFEGPGIVLLEDLDTWVSPLAEPSTDDLNGLLMINLSRGAREAVNVIRAAVENPDVYVLASAGNAVDIDPFFYEMLEPLTVVDIDYPNTEERAAIWDEITRFHPSLRDINREQLISFSSSLARYDIYMAAHDAIDDAYKASLSTHQYVPVTADNIFDKLAAYQPLDSKEYKALEDAVIDDFQKDIQSIEDFLNHREE